MEVNRAKFERQYLTDAVLNESILYISDSLGRPVCGTLDDDGMAELELLREKSGGGGIQYRDRSYFLLSNASDIFDWQYHYLIPADFEKSRSRQIMFFTLGGFLICLAAGILLSFKAVKRNYDPVHKLVTLFQQNGKKISGRENELSWVEAEARGFFREYRNIRLTMEDTMQAMKKYYIFSLLEKPFDPSRDFDEMKRYSINWAGNNFMVVLFKLTPAGNTITDEDAGFSDKIAPDQINVNLVRFMFIKRLQLLKGSNYSLEQTDTGSDPAAIVNWQGESAVPSSLEDAIEDAQNEIAGGFSFIVQAFFGGVHQGPEGVYYSCNEAKEASFYPETGDGRSIIHYQKTNIPRTGYQYPLETEQKLVNTIRIGNYEGALALLQKILKESSPKGGAMRIFVMDLLGSFIKGRLSDNDPPLESDLFDQEKIKSSEYAARLETVLREICRANRRIIGEKAPSQTGEKIKEYINENFRNPDLNVSITAIHFNMTPSYFSKLFTEATGLNMLEYITALRIDEAKKLILAGRGVNETANLCGFRESSTFIRVFRKLTGVTPGQYKNINS
jgi:AraC-like DNA-binding protein